MPNDRRTSPTRVAALALAALAVSAAAIVFVSRSGSSPPRPPAAVLPAQWSGAPREAAALQWEDAEGAAVGLADFAGKPLALNLWATWCAPCVREMPALDALAAVSGGVFSVVALNQDRDRAAARRFWEDGGFRHLALYFDPPLAAFAAFGVRGLPLTLLIDARGRELGRVEGAVEWTAPEIAAWLRALAAADEEAIP